MVPSIRQQVIYDTWTNTDSNILIEAVAGGAKTTTLMGILEHSKLRTLFLAFNKSIQQEIQERIEKANYEHAKAMTIHSLGLLAINTKYGNRNTHIKSGKNYELIKALQSYNKKLFKTLSWEDKSKVTITLMEMNDVSRIFLTDDVETIFEHMTSMDKYFYEEEIIHELWAEFLYIREESYKEDSMVIDFLDMIYVPVKFNLNIPLEPYYLLIDEAQDLNLVQHQFIDNFIAQGFIQKWVAVGDRRQAIYGFSGSFASSFDVFKEKDNVVELPLDVCYRCPSLIIEEANKVYNVMQGFKTEEGIIGEINSSIHIKPGSMVVCRNTAPLLDLYFNLYVLDKKVFIKGEDIANSVMRILKPYEYKTIRETQRVLIQNLNEIITKENKSQEEMFKMYKAKDNFKIFSIMAKNYPDLNTRVSVLTQKFQSMLSNDGEDNEAIYLCTIHKSKGLEADIVYILNENLIPSKFAKSPSQLEQEENLRYVARTRAKKEMYYLNLKEEDENSN